MNITRAILTVIIKPLTRYKQTTLEPHKPMFVRTKRKALHVTYNDKGDRTE